MSDMAASMAARMAEDGRDPNTEMITPGAPAGAADPGTGGTTQPPTAPPAEALTTDMQPDGQEPGPVPYSRFKEVNDAYSQLRGYETLAQYGYDPDSLSRLANFEANYVQDPGNTIMALVDNLDLPDESKTAIRGMLVTDDSETPAGGGTPSTPESGGAEEPPAWFKPYAERVQREDQAMRSAVELEQRNQALNEVLSHWDDMDKAAGIASPREGIKLALISSAAASGAYSDTQSLAQAARAEWIAEREEGARSHFVPPGSVTGPRSVPGSAALPSPPQNFGGDIKKATRAAMAAIERGEIPMPGSGG